MRGLPGAVGVDVVVGVSPENFAYLSESWIFTTRTLPPRQAFAMIFATGEPVVLVCGIERSHPEEESWIRDIRSYVEFTEHPMDALAAVLSERDVAKGRIGIDLQFLPHASFQRLSTLLPEAQFHDTTDAIAELRAVKSDREISVIERASLGTHRAALDAMAASKPGDSEKVMADRLLFNMISNGADGTTFLVFGSGPRSGMAHALPTARVPGPSEIIRFDFGGSFGPWQSDFARTYSTGDPTATQRQTYAALRRAQSDTIGVIRPGVAAEDVFFACRDAFKRHGLNFIMPHVGHGFGIELHETPMLRPGNKTPLAAGMVLNVEPLTLDEQRSGYQLEDLVLVTPDGFRLLTHGLAPQEIPVIGNSQG
jgi:Xaa-Pro dipeptidase